MDDALSEALEEVQKHLDNPRQAWLLGAGISYDANIPLMIPLTERVAEILQDTDKESAKVYGHIKNHLPDNAHIEHVLSHLGDLISLSERSKNSEINFEGSTFTKDHLEELYQSIVTHIRETIRYGYQVSSKNIGNAAQPIIDVTQHKNFIRALFGVNRAGVDNLRSRVSFFTTNYDTLLEDALSFEKIDCSDGFSGGGVGFWNQALFEEKKSGQGVLLHKLHGSIDWLFDESHELVKCRDSLYDNKKLGNVLIYPQQTKYLAVQKDPFSQLFKKFRDYLMSADDQVLVICGYSFGDEHINLEIANSMKYAKSKTTLLCFVKEAEAREEGQPSIPTALSAWLNDDAWGKRVFVLTDQGFYWGNNTNLHPITKGNPHDWWTFEGVTNLLVDGVTRDVGD